ncbi:MAG: AAA family ATPase [SAR324 cluster bacterium]|nr:AAA family ATPase [SAR324 cluster bacterium]
MNPNSANNPEVLRQITPRNLLSFGPDTDPLTLKSLNILIGPNGTGKSNLLEAIVLMRAAPSDFRSVIRRGGGVRDWIWKGGKRALASIDLVFSNPKSSQSLRHILAFREDEQGFQLEDERIENEMAYPKENDPYFYYHFDQGYPVINTVEDKVRKLARDTIDSSLSILAQRRDPEMYAVLSYLADVYEKIRIYREY